MSKRRREKKRVVERPKKKRGGGEGRKREREKERMRERERDAGEREEEGVPERGGGVGLLPKRREEWVTGEERRGCGWGAKRGVDIKGKHEEEKMCGETFWGCY